MQCGPIARTLIRRTICQRAWKEIGMSENITVELHSTWCEIVVNRADKRNALNWPMMQGLAEAVDDAESRPGLRAVLVRGEGPGFSAGVDLAAFATLDEHFGPDWRSRMLEVSAAFQAVLTRFESCRLPTIALLHGFALGLGLELALACDLRLAAEGTQLGLPEARLGLIPDVGGTTRLARLVGIARAKELILTGRLVDAATAERWGFVNEVVAPTSLRERAEALVGELARSAPLAVSAAKRILNSLPDAAPGLLQEGLAQAQLVQTEDFKVGLQAAQVRQAPEWRGR
jgi:enoyl-CoA hydratase/carnithine racemase